MAAKKKQNKKAKKMSAGGEVARRREFFAGVAAETAVKTRKGRVTLVPARELAKRAMAEGYPKRGKSVVHADIGPRKCVVRLAKEAARKRWAYKLSRQLALNSHTRYVCV